MKTITYSFFILSLCFFPDISLAFPTNGYVEKDMTYGQVLEQLGAPIEKKELESKREDIWFYKKKRVSFQNGKVVAWAEKDRDGSYVDSSVLNLLVEEHPIPDASEDEDIDGENQAVEKILKDLMAAG